MAEHKERYTVKEVRGARFGFRVRDEIACEDIAFCVVKEEVALIAKTLNHYTSLVGVPSIGTANEESKKII